VFLNQPPLLGPVFTSCKAEILPEIFDFEIFGFIENFGFEAESFGYFQTENYFRLK
jgi:hypothetical protein